VCLSRRCIATVAARTIENAVSLLLRACSEPLLRNGLHNPVVLLLHASMLRALHSNGSCLQRHRFFCFYLVGWDLTPIRSLCRSPRFV
jgi:hypothetical protein